MPTIKIIGSIETAETVIYSNVGESNINEGGNIGRFASGTLFRSYIRFEIPNIKGKVLDAKLGLTSTGGQSNSTTFSLHRVTESWIPEEVNTNNEPSFAPEFVSKMLYIDQSGYFDGITSMIDGMANGSIPNHGFHIKSQYENFADSIAFAGINAVDVNTRPYLEITYNESPTKPTLLEPNGGESFDQMQAITFTGSTDTEGNSIKYQIHLSIDNGITWKTLTSDATTSPYNHNFINEIETSQALIRIRAFDGFSYSDWATSDGIFTIQHNVAPFMPTNLAPNAVPVDRLKTSRLSWKHNDSPNDIQTKAVINWRHQGEALWNVITSEGFDQEYYFSPNTFAVGPIEWQVKTYDKFGIASPWSNIAVFTAAEATNVPTIILPSSVANVSRPLVEWASTTQSSYQAIVEDSLGVVIWDTGELVSMVRARTIGVDLLNGGTYKVKVRVKDGSGLFSSFAEKTFNVSYTSPAKPIVTLFDGNGFVSFNIEMPTPTDTQPSVTSHEIYKRINNVWMRIATGVNAAFNDYHVKRGQEYEYYVKALGDNDTSSNSDVVSQTITFNGSWIHAIQDAGATAQYFRYNGTGYEDSFEPESAVLKFAGRTRPVVHFGAYEDYSLTVTIQSVEGMSDMNVLRGFVRNREAICYRDSDGNLIVGYLLSLVTSKEYRVSSATITIVETDFSEGV